MKVMFFLFLCVFAIGCKRTCPQKKASGAVTIPEQAKEPEDKSHAKDAMGKLSAEVIEKTLIALTEKHPGVNAGRLKRGVSQAAALWDSTRDGDAEAFGKFCLEHFEPEGEKLDALFERLSRNFEILFGHNNRMRVDLKVPVHLEIGDILAVDKLFSAYNPGAHFNDDMYNGKIAFVTVLNFPSYTLDEKKTMGPQWSRIQWAHARMGDVFTSRVPASVRQGIDRARSMADDYIANYNIFMGKVVDDRMETLFPAEMKLISHWNLRDELKSRYADEKNGLAAQRQIFAVMNRIIEQTIPQQVINRSEYQWNPVTNEIFRDGKKVDSTPEADTRYETMLRGYHAVRAEDPYSPGHPTYIQRAFDRDLEYTEQEIENLFVTLVSSPLVEKTARLIEKRLGRQLEPFDIWYDGFKARSSIPDAELSAKTRAMYPDTAAFHRDMPRILMALDFPADKAAFVTERIQVDASRGAGHAWGAQMRSDKAHLRTRVGADGMDYKGYNIAIHELGHNVEQTLTLQDVDYYMMRGVPNTAFTEAWAFLFQRRDLELLGMKEENPLKEALATLDSFWSSYEIMGVSLLDMKVWRWLYENPDADKTQLKEAVISIAKEVWNRWYAPVFGVKDQPVLAIYSHMIGYPLYLPAYPIGRLAEFQIGRFVKDRQIGPEMVRICSQGRLVPDLWMQQAVGAPLQVEPTLQAVEQALTRMH